MSRDASPRELSNCVIKKGRCLRKILSFSRNISFLKKNSETSECFRIFKEMVENETNLNIKCCDRIMVENSHPNCFNIYVKNME